MGDSNHIDEQIGGAHQMDGLTDAEINELAENWHAAVRIIDENQPTSSEGLRELPSDSTVRKTIPITTGCLDYFPLALAYVAKISYHGNQKHNPGQPLHWARAKSNDHADCCGRHLVERGTIDPSTPGLYHDGMLAWRALANLQLFLEDLISKGVDPWA